MNAPPPNDPRERGMILINVLIIVMLATAVLAIMLSSGQDDVTRSTTLRSAAQASATASGAELSAIAALRRDLVRGGASDTLRDEWATIGDRDAKISGGRFSFTVADAQARFNINNLVRGDVASRDVFVRIAQAADIPPDVADHVATMLALTGPIDGLSDLQSVGLGEAELQRLAVLCTVLPKPTDVNVNTAPEPLLAILAGDAATARTLRARDGLNDDALRTAGLLLPPGLSQRSDYYWSRGRVTNGDTSQQLTSLIHRHIAKGQPVADAVRRWKGAAPIEAPPLP